MTFFQPFTRGLTDVVNAAPLLPRGRAGILKRRFGKRGTLLELQTMLNGTLFLDKKMPYKPMPDMLVDNAKCHPIPPPPFPDT